jgi:hypothetical protein
MREGTHQWQPLQGVALSYLKLMFIKHLSGNALFWTETGCLCACFLSYLEREDKQSDPMGKQAVFYLPLRYFYLSMISPQYPPQIDASAYSNVIIRSNAEAVGKRWKSWKPVLISKLLSASLSKKSVTGVVQTIRVESGRVSDLSEFRTSLCVIHAISICYSMVPPVVRHFLDHSVRESVRFLRLLSFKAENIQTYGHFVNSWTVFAAQRSEMRHCFEARTRFIAGADPKKAGSRPETRKSKKAKTEKSKIRKGSDKGAQEEKELKTE